MNTLLKFLPNRVWRVYRGGALLDRWRGEEKPEDGSFPEEWIASTVEARNPQHSTPGEGISNVLSADGTAERFDRLLARGAETILGAELAAKTGNTPGFLTKLLDSAIQLPIQAHPDRAAARRLFASEFGKTEAWLVLGGRRIDGVEPYLLMGFNDRFDYRVFRDEALSGKMEKTPSMMHRIPVRPGETILIPGGLPHAIGSGVLVQEIMEPTDWVIQPEAFCGSRPLTMQDRFGGLDPEEALSVFHCETSTEADLRDRIVLSPQVLSEDSEATLTMRIDREKIRFFGALELSLRGRWKRPGELRCFMAGTVLQGTATTTDQNGTMALAQGDTFAVGAVSDPVFSGNARILFALPPV